MSEPRIISIVDRKTGDQIDISVTAEDIARPFGQFVKATLEPAFLQLWAIEQVKAGAVVANTPNLNGATRDPHIVLTDQAVIAEFFARFKTPPPVPLDRVRALHGILDPDEPWSRSWYIEPPYQPEEPDGKAR